jgi:DNA polymerase-3 subunit gamma/tau
VPETIRSRCQVLLFRRVEEGDIEKRLRMIAEHEKVTIADDVIAEIAASVRGGVRDAETALERVLPVARDQGKAFDAAAYRALVARVGVDAMVDVVGSLLQGDARAALHFARDLQRTGADEREALGELVEALRWLMLLKVDGPESGLVPATGQLRERLQALAASTELHRLDAMIAAGVRGRERLRWLEDRGVVLEVSLVRMAQAGVLPTVADLLSEVRAGGGAFAHAGMGPARAAPGGAAPAPAVVAGPPADGADLRARVLAALKDRPMYRATMEQCHFEGPDEQGRVVVTLQSGMKMHCDRLQAPGTQQEFLQVIRAAAGSAVSVEFRTGGDAAPREGASAAAPPGEPGGAAKRVMNRFRGRVVQVDPEDRGPDSPVGDATNEPPVEPED